MKKQKRKENPIDFTLLSEGIVDLWKKKDDIRKAKSDFAQALKEAALKDAVDFWIKELRDNRIYNPETIENYRRYLHDLFLRGILPLKNQLGKPFRIDELHFNRNLILNILVEEKSLTDNEKRYRLNALISFSKFLETETLGFFRKFECPTSLVLSATNRLSSPKTLTSSEYNSLRNEIYKISIRDGLVVDLVYCTARPLTKILSMTLEQVDYENKKVLFIDATGSYIDVKINDKLSKDLKQYIHESTRYRKNIKKLFVTNNGKSVFRTRFSQLFQKASEKANIGFIATSKMIQRSYIAEHIKMELSKQEIMKIFSLKQLFINGDG